MPVDEKLLSVTIINYRFRENVPSYISATGFFFHHSDRDYLITNRHVLVDEEYGHFPDKIVIVVHKDLKQLKEHERIEIPLYDKNGKRWLEHPIKMDEEGKRIDVAAIDITSELDSIDPTVINAWTRNDFLPKDAIVDLGERVTVLGYPEGLVDKHNYLPIQRSGSIASAYGESFQNCPKFLLDANLHGGTSGSPVIRTSNFLRKGNEFYIDDVPNNHLMGINSGELSSSHATSMGLHNIWYPELIIDVIERTECAYRSIVPHE